MLDATFPSIVHLVVISYKYAYTHMTETIMPVLDPQILNDLTTRVVSEVHTHIIAKRAVDHSVLEVVAVRE